MNLLCESYLHRALEASQPQEGDIPLWVAYNPANKLLFTGYTSDEAQAKAAAAPNPEAFIVFDLPPEVGDVRPVWLLVDAKPTVVAWSYDSAELRTKKIEMGDPELLVVYLARL